MHRQPFGRARFVDDAFKKPPNCCVRKRSPIVPLGIFENFLFSIRLIQRQIRLLLELSDFQSATRTFVEQFHELLIEFINAPTPITEAHGAASLFERPLCAACLSDRIRAPMAATARSAASGEESAAVAFSISATSAEPMTAASARPPRTETWPGCEMPNPTAIGSCVTARARRKSAGKSSGSESLAPVTPV